MNILDLLDFLQKSEAEEVEEPTATTVPFDENIPKCSFSLQQKPLSDCKKVKL